MTIGKAAPRRDRTHEGPIDWTGLLPAERNARLVAMRIELAKAQRIYRALQPKMQMAARRVSRLSAEIERGENTL